MSEREEGQRVEEGALVLLAPDAAVAAHQDGGRRRRRVPGLLSPFLGPDRAFIAAPAAPLVQPPGRYWKESGGGERFLAGGNP